MNLKSKIATIATASLFALSIVTGAVAQDTNTVTQQIGNNPNGKLTAYIANGSLPLKEFSFNSQTSTSALTLTVEDSRGSNEGWNVQVKSNNFASAQGGYTMPASGFKFTGVGQITANPGVASGLIPENMNLGLDQSRKILKADPGKGTGIFTVPMNVELAIPAAQPTGTYTTTLTVNISNGPN